MRPLLLLRVEVRMPDRCSSCEARHAWKTAQSFDLCPDSDARLRFLAGEARTDQDAVQHALRVDEPDPDRAVVPAVLDVATVPASCLRALTVCGLPSTFFVCASVIPILTWANPTPGRIVALAADVMPNKTQEAAIERAVIVRSTVPKYCRADACVECASARV